MSDPSAPAPVPIGRRPVEDWTDGATDQAIAIAIEARDKENPPGEGDSISGSLMTQHDGGEGDLCELADLEAWLLHR